jgi:hypothetical protein
MFTEADARRAIREAERQAKQFEQRAVKAEKLLNDTALRLRTLVSILRDRGVLTGEEAARLGR